MIRGLDTTALIEFEFLHHPKHESARALIENVLDNGDKLGLTPQVISEFIHIASDPKRFEKPLTIKAALKRAETWWHAAEILQVFPKIETVRLQLSWMSKYNLGRKRILDTQLAATFHSNDIKSVITSNARDFKIFEVFTDILSPT